MNARPDHQPDLSRIAPPRGKPLVVGIVPNQSPLVLATATAWCKALGAELYGAYADPSRFPVEELPDGTVRHEAVDPDGADEMMWQAQAEGMADHMSAVVGPTGVPWHTRYLAGRADRALTHLARAIDAAAFVVGARQFSTSRQVRSLLSGSVAAHLTHHQHRPVIMVPIQIVDWKDPAWQ